MAKVSRKASLPFPKDTALQINIKVDGKLEVTDSKGNPIQASAISNENLHLSNGAKQLGALMVAGITNKQQVCICNDTGCYCFEF